jgi:hypothetical protein
MEVVMLGFWGRDSLGAIKASALHLDVSNIAGGVVGPSG